MIQLRDIERRYPVGDSMVYALRQLDVHFDAGEYAAIMGPSGSGKSTLLNIIGLLDRPNQGQYWLDGTETGDLSEEQRAVLRGRHIGFVFQSFHLIPRLSAEQNVALPLLLSGVSPAERRERCRQILSQLGLEQRAGHRPDQLSGGQRQRVAIARAAVTSPSVLLADEPTGNLDNNSGHEVMQTLEALNSQGITLLVVTHDPSIGNRARRLIRMEDGCIAADQTAEPGQPNDAR